MTVKILVGHVLDRLRDLPDASVQCVVTSPPYYGLRAYGTEPQVWGGDAKCNHIFGDDSTKIRRGTLNVGFNERWGGSPGAKKQEHAAGLVVVTGSFCSCGAWRGELGQEPTLALYLDHLLAVFAEVWRVLRPDGTLWCNIGDSFNNRTKVRRSSHQPALNGYVDAEWRDVAANGGVRMSRTDDGLKEKDLMLVPFRFAIAMQQAGWWVRNDCIWAKTACMPESVTDRATRSHEYVFHFAKAARYYYDAEAVKEQSAEPDRVRNDRIGGASGHTVRHSLGGMMQGVASRNLRTVWTLGPEPFSGSHFAVMPTEIPRRAILAGTSERGCCPRCGAPWRRVVEKCPESKPTTRGQQAWTAVTGQRDSRGGLPEREIVTTGWSPGCACDAGPPVPCTVLDIFLGSGTTALVADRLGRDCIGIELNEVYAEMARKRIASDAPLFVKIETT